MVVARLAVPIGHCIGTRYADALDGGHANRIRLGAAIVEPNDAEFAVWSAAHGVPGHSTEHDGGGLSALRDAFTGLPGWSTPEVDEAIAVLRDRGLLVEVDVASAAAREFATGHRLIPLVLGLGPSDGADGMAAVGLFGQPMLNLSPALADLWQWAPMSPDLWHACRESAAVAVRADVDDAVQTDPDAVLSGVLRALPSLLSSRVAAVDARLAPAMGAAS